MVPFLQQDRILLQTGMELFLVLVLHVALEVIGSAECFIAVRANVRPLIQVDSVNMSLEVLLS